MSNQANSIPTSGFPSTGTGVSTSNDVSHGLLTGVSGGPSAAVTLAGGLSAGPNPETSTQAPGLSVEDVVARSNSSNNRHTFPLVSLLSSTNTSRSPLLRGSQRVYVSSVDSKIKLRGKTSVTYTQIAHKIESIHGPRARIAGDYHDTGGIAIGMRFVLSQALAELAERRIDSLRGNVALTNEFSACDLSGPMARLAACISRYSQTGVLTFAQISAGNDSIRNRDKVDGRIEEGSNTVYVPRVSAAGSDSAAWYATVAAVLGCGSTVVTDSTATTREHRVALSAPSGNILAMGCIEALVRLWAMMNASGAACIASHAVIVGLNHEMSLVGHTDEGGFIRATLRRNRFQRPYGVAWLSGERLGSLAVPTVATMGTTARFVDSILVYAGASSALCDPLVLNGDNFYPCIFSTGTTDVSASGYADPSEADLDRYAREHANRISGFAAPWCENFAKICDLMVGTVSNEHSRMAVVAHLQSCFDSMNGRVDRHLRFKTVAPFYWVEPQNVLGREIEHFDAQIQGYGVYAYRGEHDVEHDALETGSSIVEDACNSMYANMYLKFSAARRNPILMHLMNSPCDGLAYILPRGLREDSLTLAGTGGAPADFLTRATRSDDIGTFLWQHASCGVIAPAECVLLSSGMSVRVVLGNVNRAGYLSTLAHFTAHDLLGKIKMSSSQLVCVGARRRSRPFTHEVNRMQTLAASALATNRGSVAAAMSMFNDIPISNTGAMPGIDSVFEEMLDPRRLEIVGEFVEGSWARMVGRVQTTVVARGLRHAHRTRDEERIDVTGGGPNFPGGTTVAAVGGEEDGFAHEDDEGQLICVPIITNRIERDAVHQDHEPLPDDVQLADATFPRGVESSAALAQLTGVRLANMVMYEGTDGALLLLQAVGNAIGLYERAELEALAAHIVGEEGVNTTAALAPLFSMAVIAQSVVNGVPLLEVVDNLRDAELCGYEEASSAGSVADHSTGRGVPEADDV